jgi:3-methyladenine DNA glycosylase AlkD
VVRPFQGARTLNAEAAIAWLERHGSKAGRDGMARYGLPSDRAFGVSVGTIQLLAKQLGKSHDLAEALWRSGWHEARLLAAYVDEPTRVTATQMDRWCRDFDNWGVCDTLCFVLFDRTPHAWRKAEEWSKSREEFVKRASFALIWSLTVHDKAANDRPFIRALTLIERAATELASTLLSRVSAQEGMRDRRRRRPAQKAKRSVERLRAKGRRT